MIPTEGVDRREMGNTTTYSRGRDNIQVMKGLGDRTAVGGITFIPLPLMWGTAGSPPGRTLFHVISSSPGTWRYCCFFLSHSW
jgi:hypothetical protein